MIKNLKNKIMQGENISYNEAISLMDKPVDELVVAANEIREHFCDNIFDVCSIINAKSGRCSEDCKFCAQSSHYKTNALEYPLLNPEKIVEEALNMAEKGVLRFSIVTSGKALNKKEVDIIYNVIKEIKKSSDIFICASLGLLSRESFYKLKEVGLERVHNNLETSRNYFPEICSTHTFDDKVEAIKMALSCGLSVCSGGIIGMGETMLDRIDLAFSLRDLNIKSVPINILTNIKGTPYENNKKLQEDEIIKTIALYRFILPDAFIRLAGGRAQLLDKGQRAFLSGANSVITGDMLTTSGISIDSDMKMINELGYKVELKVV